MKKTMVVIILISLLLSFQALFADDQGLLLQTVNFEGFYDGQLHEGSAEASIADAVITYSTDGGNSWSEVKPAVTDAGTFRFLAKAEVPGHEPTYAQGILTVKPLDVTVTITGKQNAYPYDGNEHSVKGYEVSFSSDLYNTFDFEFSGSAEASRTAIGTTEMGLSADRFKNTDPNFNVTFDVTDGAVKITPSNEVVVKITGHQGMAVYDGFEHQVSGYDFESNNSLYTQDSFEFSGIAEARRTNVGISYMGLTEKNFANRSGKFSRVTFLVTDGFQEIIPATKSMVKAVIRSEQYKGPAGAPLDLVSQVFPLMVIIKNDEEEFFSEILSVDTGILKQKESIPLTFMFTDILPDLTTGKYSADIYGIPEFVDGTEKAYGADDPNLKNKYFTNFDEIWIDRLGDIQVNLLWTEKRFTDAEESAEDLPEDNIGSYVINEEGEKEYLIFHTFEICMNYLGDEDLCRSGGRIYGG